MITRLPIYPLVAIIVALFGSAQAGTRLALVSSQSGEEIETVLDTTTALLSKDVNMQILDRAEINRVLREQQLSLAGFVGAEHAVKTGQLLHADLFAVLEGSLTNGPGATPAFGLTVFDAPTGVRYVDTALVSSNTLSTAEATAAAIRAALAKSRLSSKDLRAVGLLRVRNADLPPAFDSLCDSVGLLLERELTASPGIAVLERRRLDHINKERSMGTDTPGNRLLSSVQMISLDVGREGEGLRGVIALTDANGKHTNGVTARVPTRSAAALAHALREQVVALLSVPPDRVTIDCSGEARRFHREYLLLLRHRDYAAALRALDAAMALAPEETSWPPEMARLLLDSAIELIDPGGLHALRVLPAQPSAEDLTLCFALSQRGTDLLLDLARAAAASGRPGDKIPEILGNSPHDSLRHLMFKLEQITNSNPRITSELRLLHGQERILRMEIREPFLRGRAVDPASFALYGFVLRSWLMATYEGYLPGRNMDQLFEDHALALTRWVEVSHQINPPDGSGNYSPVSDARLIRLFHWTNYPPLGRKLARDSDPVIRIFARVSLIAPTMASSSHPTEATVAAEREFRLYAQDLLAHGEAVSPGPFRNQVWRAIHDALQMTVNDPHWGQECLEACRFAFAQGDVQPMLFRQAADALDWLRYRQPAEELEVLEGALKLVLDKPGDYPGIKPTPRPAGETRAQTNASSVRQDRDRLIADFQKRRDALVHELTVAATNQPASGPWRQTAPLLDFSKPQSGFGWLYHPLVQDGQIYFAALGFHEWGLPQDSLALARAPLSGGSPIFLGRAPIDGIVWINRPYVLNRDPRIRLTDGMAKLDVVRAACLGGGCYFAATCSGIFIFPTNGGPVLHLGATNGLPSEDAHSAAFLDGKLYAGLGGVGAAGYLVSYDLASREVRVLASSRRHEHLSPLDDQPPFSAFFLLADRARDRILLVISGTLAPSSPIERTTPAMGIWSFLPSTQEFKQLASLRLPTSSLPGLPFYWAGLPDEHTLAVTDNMGLIDRSFPRALFDLRNDQLFPRDSMTVKTNTALAPSEKHQNQTSVVTGPVFIRNGWIWSAKPLLATMRGTAQEGFTRSALTNFKVTDLPPFQSDYPFRPSECFQLLEDGNHILAADQFTLWRLDIPTGL